MMNIEANTTSFLPKLSLFQTLWYGLRSGVFYIGYALLTLWFGVTALFVRYLGYAASVRYINYWNKAVIVWLRMVCGIHWQVIGMENIPARPYVVAAKHQSQWETFLLQLLFAPICTILKKELLAIPVFGWGLASVKPIAIDRSQRREALKQILDDGCLRLAEGISVMIFPEGTRTDPGTVGRYARGGADLAKKAGVPLLPIAHNAGECWPGKRFIKYPGLVTVVIGKPLLDESIESRSLMNQAAEWIEAEGNRIARFNKHDR
jgi:1-acyl-sn-glycerol-3-phosphate acyltransferase